MDVPGRGEGRSAFHDAIVYSVASCGSIHDHTIRVYQYVYIIFNKYCTYCTCLYASVVLSPPRLFPPCGGGSVVGVVGGP